LFFGGYMKERKKIRTRYVHAHGGESGQKICRCSGVIGIRFPVHTPITDPCDIRFALGLMFSLEPVPEPDRELFPGGEILVCD
jgi:hypothetical protein